MAWTPIISNVLNAPIGSFVEGGYLGGFVSLNQDSVPSYALIVAPIAAQSGPINFLPQGDPNLPLPANLSPIDGQNNTDLLINNYDQGGALPALYAKNLSYNGFEDWYLPAYYELEILYYNLAPVDPQIYRDYWLDKGQIVYPNDPAAAEAFGQQKFNARFGENQNPYAVPNRANVPYTSTFPGQTNILAFQSGQPQAFLFDPAASGYTPSYWSSSVTFVTTTDPPNLTTTYRGSTYRISFNGGALTADDLTGEQGTVLGWSRPVRKVELSAGIWNEITLSQTPAWGPVTTSQTPGWGPV